MEEILESHSSTIIIIITLHLHILSGTDERKLLHCHSVGYRSLVHCTVHLTF